MPKPVSLTPDMMEAPQLTPQAATSPRGTIAPRPQPKPKPIPLQVRLPREEVKAIKRAALEADQTISEFMLAAFHAYIKSRKR
jgi:hypothetical protein